MKKLKVSVSEKNYLFNGEKKSKFFSIKVKLESQISTPFTSYNVNLYTKKLWST